MKKKRSPVSEKKRNDIVKQAAKLFLKKGFGAISMDEIANTADVSKRTLYNHFPTKKILFCEIVTMEWQKVDYPKIDDLQCKDPEDIFTAIMKHLMKIMYSARMQNLLKLVIAESAKFPELKLLHAEYGFKPQFIDFMAYIDHLGETNILNIDNPRIAAAQYLGLIKESLYWPWFFGVKTKPSEEEQNDVIQRANDIFFGHYKVKAKKLK